MNYDTQQCVLLDKKELAPGVFDFWVDSESFAQSAQPGQFAHLLVPGKTLRRPISICDVDRERGALRLVFEVRGEGTRILSQTKIGEHLDILAPLGHGFTLSDASEKAVFVGGGIGVPPLLYAARHYGGNATVILGFRNRDAVILEQDFRDAGCNVIVTTDDGSYGVHGFVTASLAQALNKQTDRVFACGPTPMLKAVAASAEQAGTPCQVSLEERMGCGVGACLVCACKIKAGDSETFRHVCKDGPVFDAKEVVW